MSLRHSTGRRRGSEAMLERDETLAETEADAVAAESELRRLGLSQVRIRGCGELAWLDLPVSQARLISRDPLRGEVVRAVVAAGFTRVAVAIDD